MTPAYFTDKPEAPPPPKPIPRESPKRAASRLEAGQPKAYTTITKKERVAKVRKPKWLLPVEPVSQAEKDAAEFARKYGSDERCEFVRSLPCIVPDCTRRDIENAHVIDDGSKGMGRKSGYTCIAPLCRYHHQHSPVSLHVLNRVAFEAMHGVSLKLAAAQTEIAWQKLSVRGGGEGE